jgi:hypothetical protein
MRLGLASIVLFALGCGQSATNDGAGAATSVAGGMGTGTAGSVGASGASGAATSSGGSALEMGGGGATTTAQAGSAGSAVVVGGTAGASSGWTSVGGNAGAAGSAGGAGQNPEGVPADYQLLIDESFADAASLAKLVFANPNDWVHQDSDGGYIESTGSSYAPPHYSPHSLAIFDNQKFGAFVMEAEVIQTNVSGGHRDFCFMWGMETPSRYYYAHIAEAHDGAAHNIHIVLDADRAAITKTFTPGFDWGMDVWHKIRVTRSAAGDMAVYGDGAPMPILTAMDTRLGSGYLGFGSFDDKGKVRNVKVWAPSSEKAAAPFFTAK